MFGTNILGQNNKDEDYVMSENRTDTSDDQNSEMTWIEWYCSLKGNQYYIQVDESFIRDEFNLVGMYIQIYKLSGLQYQVSYYNTALQLILDNYENDFYDDDDYESLSEKGKQHQINTSAQLLYGLIHSRFIMTSKGMHLMMQKYKDKVFGFCPNFSCENASVLPIGLVDAPAHHTAKIFCPSCNETYHPPKSSRLGLIDGAYYGTTFAHLFLMVNESVIPRGPSYYYVPKIYGYRISPYVKKNSKYS
uniref:Casein kinase II subunit beta n=1 Tax=Theileria annulata TaxID=5874 RepID=A0A3B0MH08_THEAN